MIKMRKAVLLLLIPAGGYVLCFSTRNARELNKPDPASALFVEYCAGCHEAGGNRMNPERRLTAGDLTKNNLKTYEKKRPT